MRWAFAEVGEGGRRMQAIINHAQQTEQQRVGAEHILIAKEDQNYNLKQPPVNPAGIVIHDVALNF